jgi:MFS family permease
MSHKKMLEPRIPLREIAPAVVLVLNSLTWFTLTSTLLSSAIDEMALPAGGTLALLGAYYVGIALSAFLGAYLFPRARENYLFVWMLFGTMMTVLPSTFQSDYSFIEVAICLLLGTSTGIGLPSALAYFADTTTVENRGSYGGLTYVSVGLGAFAVGIVLAIIAPSLAFSTLALWRATGLVLFLVLVKQRGRLQLPTSVPSYRDILNRKDVILYVVPWAMFSLVNFTESPIVTASFPSGNAFFSSPLLVGIVEVALAGIFALAAGILSDLVGRKRIVITGFVILGIEYAILGFFSWSEVAWYVYITCDGATWGMFASVFFMTIWGDLAMSSQKEKYYVLGGLPYLLAGFIPVVVRILSNDLKNIQNIQATAFSLASFFLFVAVIPLMYAPETLPEKRIRERELRGYLDQAKKTREKYA